MTTITKTAYLKDSRAELEEILIKNLPAKINGGNEKYNANYFKHHTKIALNKCDFIHFNSKERISIIVFDLDKVGDKNAILAYPTINSFLEYLMKTIDIEPTFVTQTQKGYHFAYHLKDHIFTNKEKAMSYLSRIKDSIIIKLGCDINGSSRNYGIWRNPLRHHHYYSECFNYELTDFNHIILPKKSIQRQFSLTVTDRQIDRGILEVGNRNNALFILGMKFAKNKKNLSQEYIESYLMSINIKIEKSLERAEVKQIARSIYVNYYDKKKIRIETKELVDDRDINFGVMEFPKIRSLSKDDYDIEVKRRQSLSAKRTNEILKDKTANLIKARAEFKKKTFETNLGIVRKAIIKLEKNNEKVNNSKLARITGLDRKTVRKYFNFPRP